MVDEELKLKTEVEKPPIKAVIFDLDGLLVDSEPLWTEARNKVLGEFGVGYDEEDKRLLMGRDYRVGLEYLINRYKLVVSVHDLAIKEQKILEGLFKKKLKLMPGAKELINEVDNSELKKAIATSSPRSRLESALNKLNLKGFSVIVTGDDIVHGKPDPEIFLKAAQKLWVDPASCLVLEDSPYGIEAANKAGMKSVAVVDSRFSSIKSFEGVSKPDLIVNSLGHLTVDELEGLFE